MRQTRKRAKPKPVEFGLDEQIELRNSELANANYNYVENMAAAISQIERDRAPAQAKVNAVFWVFGQGIGSVGVGFKEQTHPLVEYSGERLLDLVDLDGIANRGKKRGRPRGKKGSGEEDKGEEEDSESEGRRVRAREEGQEHVVRGDDEV